MNQIKKDQKINIAFCIGFEEYNNLTKLPAVKNDIELMYNILIKSTEFHQDFCFKWINFTKNEFVDKFSEKINYLKNQNLKVNTIFFYYSGHGEIEDDHFIFVCKDYDSSKPNSTSFKNEYIDNLLKSLNPDLTIKIVDACHSGEQYIKKDYKNIIEKDLHESKAKFNDLYFMFSSLATQNSKCDKNFSDFSKAFFLSFYDFQNKKIRYNDISNSICDYFLKNPSQKPYFINQGTLTHVFCHVNANLIKDIENKIPQQNGIQTSKKDIIELKSENKQKNLIEKVKIEDKNYFTRDYFYELLDKVKSIINNYNFDIIKEFFDIELNFLENIKEVKNKSEIMDWIENSSEDYFCIVRKLKEKNPDYKRPSFLNPFNLNNEPEFLVSRLGFHIIDDEIPFKQIEINFNPKFKSLYRYTISILFLFNNKNIRFFSQYIINNKQSWDIYKSKSIYQWIANSFELAKQDEIEDYLKNLLEKYENLIVESINTKLSIN
jgi:hypothetical protein